MPFKRTDSVKSVPTHLRWIVQNSDQVGKTFYIIRVMTNEEWKTITFFGEHFKFNLKYGSLDEFKDEYKELIKSFKRGYVVANMKDETDLEAKEYKVSVEIDSKPESQGGRHYEVNRGIYSIELPEPGSSEEF